VGGAASGEVASSTALLTLVNQVLRSPKWALKLDDPATREREIRELLARGRLYVQQMHAAIRERQAKDPKHQGMGTTFTSAYTVGGDLFVMHVGDSRAYSLRGGRLFCITRDHTLAQEYADLGHLEASEVDSHPLGHVLTRALGGPADTVEADTHHREIEDGDRLLLCSDGLTKVASAAEIADHAPAHPSSAAACRALIELALARGGPDNITVIVAGLSSALGAGAGTRPPLRREASHSRTSRHSCRDVLTRPAVSGPGKQPMRAGPLDGPAQAVAEAHLRGPVEHLSRTRGVEVDALDLARTCGLEDRLLAELENGPGARG
jgi:serine/threonine protein phosphatase PrpC